MEHDRESQIEYGCMYQPSLFFWYEWEWYIEGQPWRACDPVSKMEHNAYGHWSQIELVARINIVLSLANAEMSDDMPLSLANAEMRDDMP